MWDSTVSKVTVDDIIEYIINTYVINCNYSMSMFYYINFPTTLLDGKKPCLDTLLEVIWVIV